MDKTNVAIYLWPGITMLDALGPHQVLRLCRQLSAGLAEFAARAR